VFTAFAGGHLDLPFAGFAIGDRQAGPLSSICRNSGAPMAAYQGEFSDLNPFGIRQHRYPGQLRPDQPSEVCRGQESAGVIRSESASTSRPGQGSGHRHKPGLRIQTRFVISRIGFTGFWRRCQASACASRVMGCSQRLLVDISICHLQVSQSVIARSAPLSSICRNSGAPMACEEGSFPI
jgi:hypothetical protein